MKKIVSIAIILVFGIGCQKSASVTNVFPLQGCIPQQSSQWIASENSIFNNEPTISHFSMYLNPISFSQGFGSLLGVISKNQTALRIFEAKFSVISYNTQEVKIRIVNDDQQGSARIICGGDGLIFTLTGLSFSEIDFKFPQKAQFTRIVKLDEQDMLAMFNEVKKLSSKSVSLNELSHDDIDIATQTHVRLRVISPNNSKITYIFMKKIDGMWKNIFVTRDRFDEQLLKKEGFGSVFLIRD